MMTNKGDIIMKYFLILFAIIMIGCSKAPNSMTGPVYEEKVDNLCCYDNVGEVVLIQTWYGIQGDSCKYSPLNLEEKYKIDGLLITFNYDSAHIVTKKKMWGEPIIITSIKKIYR